MNKSEKQPRLPMNVGWDDGPINILIVDDEPTNLIVLETILDVPSYRLIRAESADEALLWLIKEEFALLILDIRMPGMNGFDLAMQIKNLKKTARVPIIFLSAYYYEDEYVLEGYGIGAVDYLHKPVNPLVLRAKVAIFAELHRRMRSQVAEVMERQWAESQLRDLNDTLEQRVIERTEELYASDQRIHLATETTGVGIWEWNVLTDQVRWDAQMFRIYGIPPTPNGVVSYLTWRDNVLPEDLPRQEAILQDTISRCGQSSREFRIRRVADGLCRYIQAVETVRMSLQGQVEWVVGTNLDITDRKCAEEALRESEQRLRIFSSELEQEVEARTHELTQSQACLRALAAELNVTEQRERKRLAGELHDYLAQLLVLCRLNLGQAKRIGLPQKADDIIRETEEVLNQALQYSRSLMAELYPPVLLEHGLPAALTWLGEQMRPRGLIVTVEASGGSWTLPEESAMLLFQSVRELLMNVLKHAGSNEVTVRLDQREEKLRIHVHDDGVGFHTPASPANSTPMSSGFGLLSIRERMIALGGWFDLQSAPGRGTNAMLVLPLAKVRRKASAPPLAQDAALPVPFVPIGEPVSSTVIRVLLVDDHAMVRQGLRSMLDGYPDIEVVGEAWNGEEALTLVERLRPSIVLMDINMPRMNGIEATAKITARFPSIVVIGLSVHADGINRLAMQEAGAAALLTKEAAVEELYRIIQAALDEKTMVKKSS